MIDVERLRKAMLRGMEIDGAIGVVSRNAETHEVYCRVSYQSGGVWDYQSMDAGANISTTPYVLAEYYADIREGDLLSWVGRDFQVGAVSYPTLGVGKPVCLQAQLREVKID